MYREHRATFKGGPIEYLIVVAMCYWWIGIPILIGMYVLSMCDGLWIEEGRIIHERGFLSKDRVEVPIDTIRSVRLAQSMFQRMFGTGTVYITSSGSRAEIVAKGMPNILFLRNLLLEKQNALLAA